MQSIFGAVAGRAHYLTLSGAIGFPLLVLWFAIAVYLGRNFRKAIDEKKLKAGTITVQNLVEAGLIKGRLDGVKLLGDGKITAKVEISVQKASASALKSVEKAGGSVVILKLDSAAKTAKNDSKSLRGKKSPENVKKKAEKPAKVSKAPKAAKEKKSKK